MTTTIWLNSHFSCIQSIRYADQAGEFRIIASDPNLENPEALTADLFHVEPAISEPCDYVDYALYIVQKFQVNVFFPGRYIKEIAQRVEDFQALGVKVILAADCEVLAVLDDQAALYEALGADFADLPDHVIADTPEEFELAVQHMQKRHSVVCFKPANDTGDGIKVLASPRNEKKLARFEPHRVTDLQSAIPVAADYTPQLVSEYLPGDICSVDSLASNGRLLRYVVSRTRASGTTTLERDHDIEHMVAQLVAYFKLNGVFNVQFRIKRGKPVLLSISPRMSGGITMSCLCGVDFPFWALKLALNPACENDIPKARQHPLRVA